MYVDKTKGCKVSSGVEGRCKKERLNWLGLVIYIKFVEFCREKIEIM